MITLVKGFHDILPSDAPKWAFIIGVARSILERFGFREIITPIMEKTELFQRGIGEVTDIVEKEMYTFEDRGGESLSLRPEATAGVLRAVVEHSLLHREPLLKLYTIGPMFRRERPSKGRFRQFFQINAEILGDDSPLTDAEVISAAHMILSTLGVSGLTIEINSVGCPACRSEYRRVLQDYLKDYFPELCEDCTRRYHTNPLRTLDCKSEHCQNIVKHAPVITSYLDQPCLEHFTAVQDALRTLGIPFRIQPTMVRGLDYYTRTAFELVHEELGRAKAVGGGGRYDSLVRLLGGPDVSGVGFAIGLERLAMNIADDDPRFQRRVDVYIAALGQAARMTAFKLVDHLRHAGFTVESRYSNQSLKAQMKIADKLSARHVIMIGDDELARGELTIRDMVSKQQQAVKIEHAVAYLRGEAL